MHLILSNLCDTTVTFLLGVVLRTLGGGTIPAVLEDLDGDVRLPNTIGEE
jgi:hypothetical protein